VSPVRLLFVGHTAEPTGAPIELLGLVRQLVEGGVVEPVFLLRRGGPLVERFRELGEVTILDAGYEHKLRRASRLVKAGPAFEAALRHGFGAWFRSRCRAWRIDAIYLNTITHGDIAGPLSTVGVPIICHVHEMGRFVARGVSPAQLQCLIDTVSHWVAVSASVEEMLVAHGVDRGRITIASASVEMPQPLSNDERAELRKRSFGATGKTRVVAACGIPSWTKGPELFLQVALRLRHLRPDEPDPFVAVWIGADRQLPDTLTMEEDASKMDFAGHVKILGFRQDASSLLGAADVVVSTSREESKPLVILEAAAAGIPVVCFEGSGGATDVVRAGGGLMVPYLDVDAMSAAVSELFDDPDRSATLGRAGRDYVETNATYEVTTPEIARVIKDALA